MSHHDIGQVNAARIVHEESGWLTLPAVGVLQAVNITHLYVDT